MSESIPLPTSLFIDVCIIKKRCELGVSKVKKNYKILFNK